MSLDDQRVPEQQSFLYESLQPRARIWLDFGVVDRIAAEALRGLSALPRRGIEVGGILLGRVAASASATAIHIEDSVPFECEHLYGPNFHLSPKDRDALSELLAGASSRRPRLQAVGLYRTHTRGDLELTAEDVELLDAFFPGAYALCLMVKPYATRPAEAGFFIRTSGRFRPGPPGSSFVFRRKEMGGGATPRGAAAPAASPAEETGEEPAGSAAPAAIETELPDEEAPAPPQSSYTWLWVIALITFLLAGVAIGVQIAGGVSRAAPPPPSADPFTLGLSAMQFGDAIHFRWNPKAPALEACQSASLVIRDGDNTKILDLRKEDLARGALIYRYVSADVQFRMEAILSPGNLVSESLQLRLLPPQEAPAEPAAGDSLK